MDKKEDILMGLKRGEMAEEVKGGDDKPDYRDKAGKLWLAKKKESGPELKERAEDSTH